MKKNTDELLNDYIDNQIDGFMLEEINERIKTDLILLKKLQALKTIDQSLWHIEIYPAPDGFTKKIMTKLINPSVAALNKIKSFFVSVVGLLSTSILALLLAAYLTASSAVSERETFVKLDSVITFIKENMSYGFSFVGSQKAVSIGWVASMILIISVYFIVESHINFKNKIKQINRN